MQTTQELQRRLHIAAGLLNAQDFVLLLHALKEHYADVNNEIPGVVDSIDLRKGISVILTSTIDSLGRIEKHVERQSGESMTDPADY